MPIFMASESQIELAAVKMDHWHCTEKEMQVPMQILDRSGGKFGPWDFDYLEVKTGTYKNIVKLPSFQSGDYRLRKINACSMNPMDDFIYCACQVVHASNEKDYDNFLVRVGVVDYETHVAGMEFVAKVVKGGSHFAGVFDDEGHFFFGPGKLHYIKSLHKNPGKSFDNRYQVVDETKAPKWKVPQSCKGADYAFYRHEDGGKARHFLWMIRDRKVSALEITGLPKKKPECRKFTAKGLPRKANGHFGAAWSFPKKDGSTTLYMSHNGGQGVFAIDKALLDLGSSTVVVYKAGESEKTSQNDGANCKHVQAETPFEATPAPELQQQLQELQQAQQEPLKAEPPEPSPVQKDPALPETTAGPS
ncbi:unnamed protein product, partial [Symbiodinium pilosum]